MFLIQVVIIFMHCYQNHATPQRRGIPWLSPCSPLPFSSLPSKCCSRTTKGCECDVCGCSLEFRSMPVCVSPLLSLLLTHSSITTSPNDERWTKLLEKVESLSCQKFRWRGEDPLNLCLGFFSPLCRYAIRQSSHLSISLSLASDEKVSARCFC